MLKNLKRQTFNLKHPCPGGEIGRRTVFRWQHPKGCAGSNPVPGTTSAEALAKAGFFFLMALQIIEPPQPHDHDHEKPISLKLILIDSHLKR